MEQRTGYSESNNVERHSYRGGGIMVWAEFFLGGHTVLHVIRGRFLTGVRNRDLNPIEHIWGYLGRHADIFSLNPTPRS
ncbi:hypothetical protein TNCV_1570021 [Trichonephila clavipes]|uniref:Transposase n=1 Tax=Trichonephila clavipes TaxID=2585209 RepID=A0A8X6VP42_TRICX|nr:hypothetical protein TNCV_1570021 [Trichonephila clavipes]